MLFEKTKEVFFLSSIRKANGGKVKNRHLKIHCKPSSPHLYSVTTKGVLPPALMADKWTPVNL